MKKKEVTAPKRGRGRPPKSASSSSSSSSPVVAVAKRRGRPPLAAKAVKSATVVKEEAAPVYTTGAPGTYKNLQMLIPSMKTPAIETWDFEYPGSKTDLSIEIPEFTCVCPKTGLPDFATIMIDYCPNKLCIELKSLKEYILFYRNLGIFHEHVVNRMLLDIAKACKPKSMTITGVFNSRGGIQTTVQATL